MILRIAMEFLLVCIFLSSICLTRNECSYIIHHWECVICACTLHILSRMCFCTRIHYLLDNSIQLQTVLVRRIASEDSQRLNHNNVHMWGIEICYAWCGLHHVEDTYKNRISSSQENKYISIFFQNIYDLHSVEFASRKSWRNFRSNSCVLRSRVVDLGLVIAVQTTVINSTSYETKWELCLQCWIHEEIGDYDTSSVTDIHMLLKSHPHTGIRPI